MAKRKKKQDRRQIDEIRKSSRTAISSLISSLGGNNSLETIMAKDLWKSQICVPFPCFALEYLFDNVGLVLGKVLHIYGPPKSSKSGLCFEIARWFIDFCGGVASIIEHESKISAEWVASTVGWDNFVNDTVGIIHANSVDDWQKKLKTVIALMKEQMVGKTKADKGIGMDFPFLAVIDSVLGKPANEVLNKYKKEGAMDRMFPIEALMLNNFLKALPGDIANWPFLVILVSHLKVHKNNGVTEYHVPGGYALFFHESFELRVRKAEDIRTAKFEGNKLELIMMNNAYGSSKRRIFTEVLWATEDKENPVTGAPYRQRTVWNWNKSTTLLLLGKPKDDPKIKEARKLIGLADAGRGRCYAPGLGVDKKEPVTYQKMGAIIHKNKEYLNELRRLFGIKQSKIFVPGIDFNKQLEEARLVSVNEIYKALSADEEGNNGEHPEEESDNE